MTAEEKAWLLEKIDRRVQITKELMQGIPKDNWAYSHGIGELDAYMKIREIVETIPGGKQ